jgi:hypothetical protein
MLAINFPHDSYAFRNAALTYILKKNMMEWLLANNFPYNKSDMLLYAKDSVVKEWVDKNL